MNKQKDKKEALVNSNQSTNQATLREARQDACEVRKRQQEDAVVLLSVLVVVVTPVPVLPFVFPLCCVGALLCRGSTTGLLKPLILGAFLPLVVGLLLPCPFLSSSPVYCHHGHHHRLACCLLWDIAHPYQSIHSSIKFFRNHIRPIM